MSPISRFFPVLLTHMQVLIPTMCGPQHFKYSSSHTHIKNILEMSQVVVVRGRHVLGHCRSLLMVAHVVYSLSARSAKNMGKKKKILSIIVIVISKSICFQIEKLQFQGDFVWILVVFLDISGFWIDDGWKGRSCGGSQVVISSTMTMGGSYGGGSNLWCQEFIVGNDD